MRGEFLYYIDSINRWRYGAMVIDGASPTLTQMSFSNINTSSVLTTNLAQPIFVDGTYIAGNDQKVEWVVLLYKFMVLVHK